MYLRMLSLFLPFVYKLTIIFKGGYATTYRSGLSAAFAAFVHCRPKRIAIRRVYFGVHETIDVYKRTNPELASTFHDDRNR